MNLITLEDNFIYNIHTVLKINESNIDDKINLSGNFKAEYPINFSPKFVTNYVTNKKEIIFQDELNNLYLISLNGELIWKKNIENKIIGDIQRLIYTKMAGYNLHSTQLKISKSWIKMEKL